MAGLIETTDDVRAGVERLIAIEPAFARVVDETGLPPLRRARGGFAGLVHIVTEQLISLNAAAAIWQRMEQAFDPVCAESVARAGDEVLADCGQSRAKIRTIRCVIAALEAGDLDFERLGRLSDEDAAAELTAITGIGPWTCDVYLLSCLGRADVWPAGDLALQVGAQLLFDLDQRPDARQMLQLAESWRPLRAVAARLLWSWYRHKVLVNAQPPSQG